MRVSSIYRGGDGGAGRRGAYEGVEIVEPGSLLRDTEGRVR